jgi:hypothetical protein
MSQRSQAFGWERASNRDFSIQIHPQDAEGHQGVSRIVALAEIADDPTGVFEKPTDCPSKPLSCEIEQLLLRPPH